MLGTLTACNVVSIGAAVNVDWRMPYDHIAIRCVSVMRWRRTNQFVGLHYMTVTSAYQAFCLRVGMSVM